MNFLTLSFVFIGRMSVTGAELHTTCTFNEITDSNVVVGCTGFGVDKITSAGVLEYACRLH